MAKSERDIPEGIKLILEKDIKLTKFFINKTKNSTLFRSIKTHHRMFEISCHGILWLSVSLGSIWLLGAPNLYQLQANLLLALILDIIIIATLKAVTRRRRPAPSPGFGPDKFSFPSGHASRAALVMYIFMVIDPVSMIFFPPLLAWVIAVCFSRIIAERHYILDVCAGFGIGIIEGFIVSIIWLSPSLSNYFISYLSNEKAFGGEYHV